MTSAEVAASTSTTVSPIAGVSAPEKVRDADVVYVVGLFLAIKLGLLVLILLGSQLLPFNWDLYNANLVWPLGDLPDWLRPFNTWDTQQYLLLAGQGYGSNAMSDAFYPLYPMLIRAFTPVFMGHALFAAWSVSNVASLFVPVYMYKLARLFWTGEQSTKIVLLLLSFPTAFFLSMGYTEALYLTLCLGAFYYLFRGDVLKASIFCFLLPLVRAQALLFVLPIVVMALQTALGSNGSLTRSLKLFLAPALATVLGVGAYLVFCQWQLGSFTGGLDAQRYFIADNSIGNLFDPVGWFRRNFLDLTPSLHGYTNSILDRVMFVLALPVLIGTLRTQHLALGVYAILTLLVPALSGTFMSYTRFVLLAFPLFMYLGSRFKHAELLAAPMFALQALLLIMHTGGYWVA